MALNEGKLRHGPRKIGREQEIAIGTVAALLFFGVVEYGFGWRPFVKVSQPPVAIVHATTPTPPPAPVTEPTATPTTSAVPKPATLPGVACEDVLSVAKCANGEARYNPSTHRMMVAYTAPTGVDIKSPVDGAVNVLGGMITIIPGNIGSPEMLRAAQANEKEIVVHTQGLRVSSELLGKEPILPNPKFPMIKFYPVLKGEILGQTTSGDVVAVEMPA